MNKKIVIPTILSVVIVVFIIAKMCGSGEKIQLEWDEVNTNTSIPDTIELKAYVENSGSMDAYMCDGSDLKDAVYDYVSDMKKFCNDSCSLYYINSEIVPCKVPLDTYIKNLTPSSFAKAGGNRVDTDLREIFKKVLANQTTNTVSVLISDCILDIPQDATNFFGNCQVSIKNTFNEALTKNPELGVMIMKLKSKYNGYWYCGKNKEYLSNQTRPYYIWVIGDKSILSKMNKKIPYDSILGGIENYCAFSTSQSIPFAIEKKRYVVNHTGKINVEVLVDLSNSLQSEIILTSLGQYTMSNPTQMLLSSIQKIKAQHSRFSHVLNLEIENPKIMNFATITFSYPSIQKWVEESNDNTGEDVKNNMDKTTGILYLIKGVSEAYKNHTTFGNIEFNLKNK